MAGRYLVEQSGAYWSVMHGTHDADMGEVARFCDEREARTYVAWREARNAQDWRARFLMSPSVWALRDRFDAVLDLYENKEAATIALEWAQRHKENGYLNSITKIHIHTLELSKERWGGKP